MSAWYLRDASGKAQQSSIIIGKTLLLYFTLAPYSISNVLSFADFVCPTLTSQGWRISWADTAD